MIVDKINTYLSDQNKTIDEALRYEIEKIAGACFKRQFMDSEEKDGKGRLWFSSLGKCPRQLAYQYHGFEKAGKEIDGRARIIFWTGDLIEMTVVGLAKLAGCNIIATGLQQMRLELPINGGVVSGRPDGLLMQDKETYLVEVKSMSSFRFRDFENGIIDESYLVQVNSEMEALGVGRCIFVGLNKDNGVLHERLLSKDDTVVDKARQNVLAVLHSTPEQLPEPPQELNPNDKGFYPWNCLYCSYWKHCRTNAETVLVGNSNKLREKNGTDKSADRPKTTRSRRGTVTART